MAIKLPRSSSANLCSRRADDNMMLRVGRGAGREKKRNEQNVPGRHAPCRPQNLQRRSRQRLAPLPLIDSHWRLNLKKPFRGFRRGLGDFFQRNAARGRDRSATMRVCAGSHRFPRKGTGARYGQSVSTMNFQRGTLCRDLAHGCTVFESHDAGERNEMIEIENFICLFERAAEAMKNAAQFSGVRLHDLERVVPRVALMDDHIEPAAPPPDRVAAEIRSACFDL